jgi:predicted nucleic acid-binding protein
LDRVFLDANVLFSAAYAQGSRLLELWSLENADLVTSLFALEEARRNLLVHNPEGLNLLGELVSGMTMVTGTRVGKLPDDVMLADKDIPILLAAIDSGCSHLLTGDKRHFDMLYGKRVGGVLVQTPAQYLHCRASG